jgi:hypothetical protein
VETAGVSGGTAPTWGTTTGGTKTDGTVTWLNQGLLSATITAPAFALFPTGYSLGAQVIDSNGNIELCTVTFFGSCAFISQPSWALTPGATTTAGLSTFENLGANGIPALTASGGTSGITIDNTVPAGTEAGASQIYYSTLTGSNVVQASQAALK